MSDDHVNGAPSVKPAEGKTSSFFFMGEDMVFLLAFIVVAAVFTVVVPVVGRTWALQDELVPTDKLAVMYFSECEKAVFKDPRNAYLRITYRTVDKARNYCSDANASTRSLDEAHRRQDEIQRRVIDAAKVPATSHS